MNEQDPPLPIGPLTDAENRLRSQFSDLSAAWNQTREDWTDTKRVQFERQHLSTIGPALNRLSGSLTEFMDLVRAAERELQDPG